MKKTYLTILLIVPVLVFLAGISPAEGAVKEKFEESFNKIEKLAKDGRVSIKNVSGKIEIATWNKDEVKIDAVKISRASSMKEAEENAALVKINVTNESDLVRIETEYPRRTFKRFNVSVEYILTIPNEASIRVANVSGSVNVKGIGGTTDISVTSGNLICDGAKRVDLETISGNMDVSNIEGDAFLKATSGRIEAVKITGSVEAEVVSGGIELRGVSKADRVKAKAISGTLVYEGDINPNGIYELKVHSGTIKMILPSNAAFDLDASTFSGSIDTDFDVSVTGAIKKKELRGKVNGGGAEVELEAFSGTIRILKK
ncbi:MAG: DUF4097 family beta strand repeat protein [Candidatus Aminicenantes bacterium]|nr:DUF4097 family beta strand repeat protein [Candidatus Aminicenantes bacterium]